MIIGICGFKGSGKDTIGRRLVERGFVSDSFANPVKDALVPIMGWERDMLEGATKESREWRETPDPFWSEVMGKPFTPRMMLQQFGTNIMRGHFHKDVWVQSMKKRLLDYNRQGVDVVVTDCRFPNEIALLREMNATMVRVVRGPDPSWVKHALKANSGSIWGKVRMKMTGIHPSEWAWIGQEMDVTIQNDHDVQYLMDQADRLL